MNARTVSAGTVIVGAGFAAGECAIRLRQAGYAHAITMVGSEAHLPYHRPPLSKAYLSGAVTQDTLLLRPDAAYAKAEIGFTGGVTVEANRPRRQNDPPRWRLQAV